MKIDGKLLVIGTVLLVVVVVGAGWLMRKSDESKISSISDISNTSNESDMSDGSDKNDIGSASGEKAGLKIEDLVVGTGEEAVAGKKIVVNYRGTLVDGTEFDSSYKRSQPFEFTLGAGEVIAGWDQGFAGMKVGGKRKLTISPELGYGSRGAGALIPPNSTLVFEVELVGVGK